jgi:tetrahydromethanopterin S-methyltransferase subunit G
MDIILFVIFIILLIFAFLLFNYIDSRIDKLEYEIDKLQNEVGNELKKKIEECKDIGVKNGSILYYYIFNY